MEEHSNERIRETKLGIRGGSQNVMQTVDTGCKRIKRKATGNHFNN